jgi:hypothetical protein
MVRQPEGDSIVTVYAIDPGTEQSALVWMDHDSTVGGYVAPNVQILTALGDAKYVGHLVIEQIESYGMPVGREVFETVFWAGRFAQRWSDTSIRRTWSMLPRKDVKLTLCGSPRAKDPNIRQALIDRYGGALSIRKGGSLAGIKSHLWAALAVGVAYQDIEAQKESHAVPALV